MGQGLWRYSLFGGVLSAAGLPIYIHAPKFYVDSYGVSLAALGGVLFLLRLIDVVQDPLFGWMTERFREYRAELVGLGGVVMALSMIGLFAITPPVAPTLWFALTLTGLFSGFSLMTIAFYTQGVLKAEGMGAKGHTRLATWRETGALLGVSLATLAPVLLAFSGAPFTAYAVLFAGLALLAIVAMSGEWGTDSLEAGTPLSTVLRDPTARRLLLIALMNATPVAITSTLFLFFVESRLGAPDLAGPLLLAFFVAAAVSAPIWGTLARQNGEKRMLIAAMVLAIASFVWALTLGTGETLPFLLICLASGAALGADLTLLPAMFAARMGKVAPNAGQAFGIWSFVNKFALAFAAIALLPLLEARGFQSGLDNTSQALWTLSALYAGIPCVLKLVALGLLVATPMEDD